MKVSQLLFVLSILLILFTGCAKEQSIGQPAGKDAIKASLTEVLETPDKFHQKEVILEGIVTGQCGSRCEFFYSENGTTVPVYMGEIKAPAIQSGTPVKVNAKVFKGDQKVILTANGFILKKKADS